MPPSAPLSATSRFVRVQRPTGTAAPGTTTSIALPVDALGYSLLLAARIVAGVLDGRSSSDALATLGSEPPAARAAAQDLVYGVLRRYGWGEFLLGQLLKKPISHKESHALLLSALYRLETRPEATHMVVDQAVSASGELSGGAFKGLVNGVLRSFLRQRESLLAAASANDVVAAQHPQWWLLKLRKDYPADWRQMVEAGNSQPPMTLRVNQRKTTSAAYHALLESAGLHACPIGICGLRLCKPVAVEQLPGFGEGLVSVQDAGAQRAAELLDPLEHSRVLDACAAPGGKTAHLLERRDLDLLALDIDGGRVRRVEQALQRLGLRATVRAANCSAVGDWWDGRPFDAILADVPCSASGVVRRHPDIKWLRRESDIRRFAKMQASILDALWPLLREGGKLLYATCSVFPEENKGQIDAFLVRRSGAELLFQEQLLPGEESDGFYYALLRKIS